MATQSAVFTFSLPEDIDSNYLYIYESTTENGTYSQVAAVSYDYGTLTYEYDSLDDTKWYKIRFYNSTDTEWGPYSDPVYGGDFDNAAPFLAVSTTTDGAHYATPQDVLDYSNLTTSDVTTAQLSVALKRARAIVDIRTADLDLDRFQLWETEVARKKYNATLQIIKEAEINIALGNLYRMLSDDIIMKKYRDANSNNTEVADSISIGNTSLSGFPTLNQPDQMREFAALANRYLEIGMALLAEIQPNSVRFTSLGGRFLPRFRYPFNGFNY